MILFLTGGVTQWIVVRAAYKRVKGKNGPRRCTLPSIASCYPLSASLLHKPRLYQHLYFLLHAEKVPWNVHSAKAHEILERLPDNWKTVSSKLTRLGSGPLLFFCFSVNTKIWQPASKHGTKFSWGRRAKQVYFQILIHVFSGGYLFFSSGKSVPLKVVWRQRTQSATWKSGPQSRYTWNKNSSDCRSRPMNTNKSSICCNLNLKWKPYPTTHTHKHTLICKSGLISARHEVIRKVLYAQGAKRVADPSSVNLPLWL